MEQQQIRASIESGKTVLGIELGSTRIKAVLIDAAHRPIAAGSHAWESRLEHGIWTYPLEEVWDGIRACYARLAAQVCERYGAALTKIGAIGFSGMMHGYLAFDKSGNLLTPFRTWRNTITGQAAEALTSLFSFNIPQRWSIAHLHQAMLNREEHVKDVAHLTTLAGYVHWQLTGQKVLGVGDASGMFPIEDNAYSRPMLAKFQQKADEMGYTWKIEDLLPTVLTAGEAAGVLTEAGARLIDPSGTLLAGVPLCPPEGDAGTGMAATNSVAIHTGNVSAGTSIFSMVVLDKPLHAVYPEIDMVTTPAGQPVAMVHCNTCTSDLDAWVGLFSELLSAFGHDPDKAVLYDLLYQKALKADSDCGSIVSFNYYSGEPVAGAAEGCPLLARRPDGRLTLANFMRAQLFSAMAALRIGMDILFEKEHVRLDRLTGHGGFFKTKGVGQRMMASAMGVPVSVLETAGEGGAWGIALLASYLLYRTEGETLEDYLAGKVFGADAGESLAPDDGLRCSFEQFMARYIPCLAAEQKAAAALYDSE